MSAERVERRRDVRQPYPRVIEYSLTPSSNEKLKGVAVNLSSSGLALYVFRHLMQGQEIHIRSFMPVDYRKASVRWVRAVDEGILQAGFMFVG
jgi:c-di-GMP-binding flagellar brake protein YcgR